MSSEKVRQILERADEVLEEERKKNTRIRYEVLKHYGIREPYDEVSDEDYEKIYELYKRESKKKHSKKALELFDNAEYYLNKCSQILLICGIIAFVVLFITAIVEKSWSLFGIGVGVLFATIGNWSFFRVFVNISLKLDKLNKSLSSTKN